MSDKKKEKKKRVSTSGYKQPWMEQVDEFLTKLRLAKVRCKGRSGLLNVIIPEIFKEYGETKLAKLYKSKTESDRFAEVFGEEKEEEVEGE